MNPLANRASATLPVLVQRSALDVVEHLQRTTGAPVRTRDAWPQRPKYWTRVLLKVCALPPDERGRLLTRVDGWAGHAKEWLVVYHTPTGIDTPMRPL